MRKSFQSQASTLARYASCGSSACALHPGEKKNQKQTKAFDCQKKKGSGGGGRQQGEIEETFQASKNGVLLPEICLEGILVDVVVPA